MMQASVADIIGSQVRVEKDFATDLSDLLQVRASHATCPYLDTLRLQL